LLLVVVGVIHGVEHAGEGTEGGGPSIAVAMGGEVV
jgi:hypothetical protein